MSDRNLGEALGLSVTSITAGASAGTVHWKPATSVRLWVSVSPASLLAQVLALSTGSPPPASSLSEGELMCMPANAVKETSLQELRHAAEQGSLGEADTVRPGIGDDVESPFMNQARRAELDTVQAAVRQTVAASSSFASHPVPRLYQQLWEGV
eukprot:CAMPEP_0171148424 /NCGR_PEP_ID=MMETSP0766_2-20121228/148560_1 /TAXON_ID=439317 /ORGANISM="Gambierdiscus australes, Strain CAWD 149" /LENGTH=153 /DNA_ID=CAMNT_0011612335 /DNA_START=742 /DNA_END=1200 /DNA_ORIENTATION=+